jgi:protein-tyrosine phosphatase
MPDSFTVLTVCTGNIHRSPLAEVLLRRWADWYLPLEAARATRTRSAGLFAPKGSPMGRRAQAIAASLGADGADGAQHRATLLTDDMVRSADLVLTASLHHRDAILERVPGALRYTFTIREAGRLAADLPHRQAGTHPAATPPRLATLVASLADRRSAPPAAADDDIVDPQGRGDDAYLEMTAQLVPALAQLATVLFGMPEAERAAYLAAVADPAALAESTGVGSRP